MRPGGRRVRRSISVRPRGQRVGSGAFASFLCAVWVVRFVWVRSVHSHAPLGSSGPFECVWFIHVRRWGRRILSVALSPFPCALREVGFVRVRSVHSPPPGGRRGRSGPFGQFPFSRGPSSSFVCVWSMPVHNGVGSGAFGPFPCALEVFGFVMVCSAHSCPPRVSF